jgi:NADPH-dependent 2,4-dienoyl-CoA reductase/sulfur reductase-like enzyme
MTQSTETSFDYLLIGGGMASGYAAKAIREQDQTGTIAILSSDQDIPYERPALTKKLWTDEDFTEEDIPITTEKESGFVIQYETVVTSIDKENQTVTTENGETIGYKQLLLATGGEPQRIDGPEDERVIAFRSWKDYRTLRRFSESEATKDIVVVGGSYIGTELAANLALNGSNVHFVYPQEILGDNRFPEEIAREYEEAYRKHGITLKPDTKAESYDIKENKVVVSLSDGSTIQADALVLGLGVEPRLSLAKEAGLDVDEGVVVNEYLQTSDPHIYAAGDIAYYPDPILGMNRIEHVDHARQSGTTVGKNMAGANEPYDYTPYFYSDVFDISWKAIGTLNPELDVLIDPVDDGKVVYYLEDDKPVGILTWNVEPDLDDIRKLLKDPPSTSAVLNGAIQNKEE